MDPSLAMTVTGGTISVAAVIIAIIQWSLKRNVDHEDKAKDKLESRLEGFERDLRATQSKQAEAEGGLRNATTTLGEIRGVLQELRGSIDSSRDKQAQHYRDELEKVETGFRQELSRHVHPDLPERVTKLEALLSAEETAPKRKRR